jgi:asparagine synthase (glutamine-hydrolysing)
MTGFLIEVGFDRPNRPEREFRQMLDSLKFKGRSGVDHWSIPGVQVGITSAFTDQAALDGVNFFYDSQREVLIVADARLDAVRDLVDSLQTHHRGEIGADSVAVLLLAAYARWGNEFPKHVQGDFGCCVVDLRKKRVIAVRDRFGMRRVFYRQAAGRLTISNHLGSIYRSPDFSPDLDWIALSDFLLFGNVNELDTELTPYSEIRMVPHANSITWRGDGRQAKEEFWSLPADVEIYDYRSEREVLERFDAAMRAAVGDRLQVDSAVIALSGGLDSTAIAWFAAEHWKSGKGPRHLSALTAVDRADHPEAILASRVSRRLGISHVVHVVERGHASLEHQDTPFPNTNLYGYQQSTLRRVSELGERSLVGHAGDYAFAPELGASVTDMIRLTGLKKTAGALSSLRRQFKYRPPWGTGLRAFLMGQWLVQQPESRPELPPWIKADHVEEFDLEARWKLYWQRQEPGGHGHALRPGAFGWFRSYNHWGMREEDWSLPFSPAEVSDPYLDFRVLELLWRLPPLPWYHKKYLLRKAMNDRLPIDVLNRPKTPAGKWLRAEGTLPFPAPWEPHPLLRPVIDPGAMVSRPEGPRRAVEVFPYFLDSWLNSMRSARSLGHLNSTVDEGVNP